MLRVKSERVCWNCFLFSLEFIIRNMRSYLCHKQKWIFFLFRALVLTTTRLLVQRSCSEGTFVVAWKFSWKSCYFSCEVFIFFAFSCIITIFVNCTNFLRTGIRFISIEICVKLHRTFCEFTSHILNVFFFISGKCFRDICNVNCCRSKK